jgi:hypothetical protein
LAKRRVVHVQTLFSLWFCPLASFAEVGFVCGKCQRRSHTRTKPVSSAQDRGHNNLLTSHAKNKARRSKPHRALITVLKDALFCMNPASFASKICSAFSRFEHIAASINLVLRERACARLEGRPQAEIVPAAILRDGASRLLRMRSVGLSSIHSIRLVSWNRSTTAEAAQIEPLLCPVMRGLDPRIHLLAKMMDCRVKPGNDNRFNMAGNRSKQDRGDHPL